MIRSSNGRARGPGAESDRVVVDRDQALAAAHLLDDDVGEQVAAHRPLVVGDEALALARDRDRHEVERVELGVGVLERGAGSAALVDDQLHVGGGRRCARIRSRQPATAAASSSSPSSAIAVWCSGELTITSWAPGPGARRRGRARRDARSGSRSVGPASAPVRRRRPRRAPSAVRAPGRGSARPGAASRGVGAPAAGAVGPDLGRRRPSCPSQKGHPRPLASAPRGRLAIGAIGPARGPGWPAAR